MTLDMRKLQQAAVGMLWADVRWAERIDSLGVGVVGGTGLRKAIPPGAKP
jgi:hypothetical protein